MTRKTKLFLRGLAAHFGLRIKYVGALSPKISGFLDPSPMSRTIVVNAAKSKSDHAFTIAHEIAHYILHCQRLHRFRLPWFLTRQWKSKKLRRVSKLTVRLYFRDFNAEQQADLWAFATLMYIGATDDVLEIFNQHPDKRSGFWICATACIYTGIKQQLKSAFQPILHAFNFLFRSGSPKSCFPR
jgi:hypothetical protein